MAKGKDFYGKDIADVIDQACKALEASREDLDIEVLETGSAGIFGLCKKKAHIRVQRKAVSLADQVRAESGLAPTPAPTPVPAQVSGRKAGKTPAPAPEAPPVAAVEEDTVGTFELPPESVQRAVAAPVVETEPMPETEPENSGDWGGDEAEDQETDSEPPIEAPDEESLVAIQADLYRLLQLMGLPSEVQVLFEDNTVQCTITGAHEEQIVGPEGRTLDSLQYLLRKMVARHLPDRVMLALNAGDFRERRTEELKVRARELAEQVKVDGKTMAIPALNPSERRVVHMVLQEDKEIRSRSVGDGLFKKVLIYKPGKGRRPAPRKRRGGQGGRPSGD